tara:strand:+ start:1742 stop:1969 length:228 start_codon:yes stop_codon:yes gene_type:complete
MINFEYNDTMKRWDVKIPFTLKTNDYKEEGFQTVASISEDDKVIFHRDIHLTLMRQVLLAWDEFSLQITENEEVL